MVRLMVLMALFWSTDWMCMVTIWLESMSRKSFNKLVAQVGSRDIQKADRSEDAAHLKGAAVLKGQAQWGQWHPSRTDHWHKVFPVEVELVGSIHVQHPVHQLQPLRTVQRLCQNAQPVKVVHQVVLDVVEPGL